MKHFGACPFEKGICHAKRKKKEGKTGGRARNISRIYALDVVNERALFDFAT